MKLPVGLIFVSILEVINLRDIEKDRLVGKQTFAEMPGKLFVKSENIFCLPVPFLCLPVLSAFEVLPWWPLFPYATCLLVW